MPNIWTSSSTPRFMPKRMKACTHKNTRFIAALFVIVQLEKITKISFNRIDKQVVVYSCTRTINREKITQKKLQVHIITDQFYWYYVRVKSERSQKQNSSNMIIVLWSSRTRKVSYRFLAVRIRATCKWSTDWEGVHGNFWGLGNVLCLGTHRRSSLSCTLVICVLYCIYTSIKQFFQNIIKSLFRGENHTWLHLSFSPHFSTRHF